MPSQKTVLINDFIKKKVKWKLHMKEILIFFENTLLKILLYNIFIVFQSRHTVRHSRSKGGFFFGKIEIPFIFLEDEENIVSKVNIRRCQYPLAPRNST